MTTGRDLWNVVRVVSDDVVNAERNNEIFSKLRNPSKYLIPYSRTKKYQSFLNYALAKFQNSM